MERIFAEYVADAGIGAIAEGLNRDRIPSPSGHDPARNRHRAGAHGAWGKSAVRAIIGNPKYSGRMTWNRQRRDEILLDVEDVAAGYTSKMAWNDRADWIWSAEPTHEAIVSPETFAAASAQRQVAGHRQAVVKPRRQHIYALTSLVQCGLCGRRMAGSWNHDQAHYRCRFPSEYAGATGKHPRWVYLRERQRRPVPSTAGSSATSTRRTWTLRSRLREPRRRPTTARRLAPRRPAGRSPTVTTGSASTAPLWKRAPTPPSWPDG